MKMTRSRGNPGELPIHQLHLDPLNPRLPEAYQDATESDLLKYVAETYSAIEVARSIALHGYFNSEPLIVISETDDSYIVVEGNRRLVALRVLAEPTLANELDDSDEWRTLAGKADLPARIPVIIAPDPQSVAPIIGYRHISGIEPWEPYPQARFIASLVDNESLQFQEVANLVGERSSDVAAKYRNFAVVTQAKDDFGIDVSRVIGLFGVFTRVMTSSPLRAYIGAPAPVNVHPGKRPLHKESGPKTQELFSWVFGENGISAVIGESRDITRLGQVVSSEVGLEILKETRDLEASYISAGGLRDRLLSRLKNAHNNLEAAREDLAAYNDSEEVQELLSRCQESLRCLVELDDSN